jgi:hypothetical protein
LHLSFGVVTLNVKHFQPFPAFPLHKSSTEPELVMVDEEVVAVRAVEQEFPFEPETV